MEYDFIIIGGGIAGLSVGGRLATSGSVCVLEAEDVIGYHASGPVSYTHLTLQTILLV